MPNTSTPRRRAAVEMMTSLVKKRNTDPVEIAMVMGDRGFSKEEIQFAAALVLKTIETASQIMAPNLEGGNG